MLYAKSFIRFWAYSCFMAYRFAMVVIFAFLALSLKAQIHQSTKNAPDQITINTPEMFYPVDGVLVSGHHWRGSRFHHGLDISHNNRDTVKSAWLGRVRYAKTGYNGGYGYLVIVTHLNGLETYYAHLRELLVEEGDWIPMGKPVGIVGSTGNSLGPHLHFEIRYNGISMDPEQVLGKNSLNLRRKGSIYNIK